MRRRTIFIGDVHGCAQELEVLLKDLAPTGKDRVIFIGDLINKGPDSLGVWKQFRGIGAEAILGNHELRLLDDHARGGNSQMNRRIKKEFGKHYDALLDDLILWPTCIESRSWVAVHAGLLPGRNLTGCRADQLCNIRTWDGRGRDLQNPNNPPWYDFYHGKRMVVFGHWAARHGVFDRKNVIGLDTGCVYGGELTAWIMEEDVLVSVKAFKSWCKIG